MRELTRHLRWVKHHLYWARRWAHRKATSWEIDEAITFLDEAYRELDRARAVLIRRREEMCEKS